LSGERNGEVVVVVVISERQRRDSKFVVVVVVGETERARGRDRQTDRQSEGRSGS
jgi:dsRNA-specific ribonuclease